MPDPPVSPPPLVSKSSQPVYRNHVRSARSPGYKVGGRVQSRVLDFGDFDGGYTVEDGANWITDYPGNQIFDLAQEYELGMALQEFFDIDAYQDGVPIPSNVMDDVQREFEQAWQCLQQFTNVPYNNGGSVEDGTGQSQIDIGAIALLEMCRWSITEEPEDNIKYFWQWYYLQFEYAQEDVSLSTFPGRFYVMLLPFSFCICAQTFLFYLYTSSCSYFYIYTKRMHSSSQPTL